ncbi:hypothetical protein [Orrella sp. 11846]|uniref:hypothetical protein n=1 Tax=Orrella sp. 11846 TaxID=3409913 RepID=UPI003B5B6E19
MSKQVSETSPTAYATLLAHSLQAQYGACSRAEPQDIEREVLRINHAVRDLSHRYLNPLQPLVSFHAELRNLQDPSNQEFSE